MKIMCFTDPMFAGTGFSEEARNIAFRLAQSGHEIFWVSMNLGYPVNIPDSVFPDIPQKGAYVKQLGYVGSQQSFGSEAVKRYYNIYHPDLMFVMGDPMHIAPYLEIRKKLSLPLLFYVTLDGLPIYPDWGELLSKVDINVSMTEWAMKEYQKANMPIHAYVHHGINWNYWQISNQEKQDIRTRYGIDNDTTIFINWDVNQYRKRPDALLRCWKNFNPIAKNAKLILFTDWNCRLGFDIEAKITQYDIPRESIISPMQLIGRDKIWEVAEEPWLIREIAALGNIYVSTTGGEGFGKCLLEAMTARMPVIAPNYSAVPEVLDKYGVLIPCYEGRAGRYQMHDIARFTELGIVNEDKFTESMIYYYQNPKESIELGLKANDYTRLFDYDTQTMIGWHQILENINPDVMMSNSLLRN